MTPQSGKSRHQGERPAVPETESTFQSGAFRLAAE
jgi:hypothetical protein